MFEIEHSNRVWHYVIPKPHAATLLNNMAAPDQMTRMMALYDYLEHVLLPESLDQLWEISMDENDPFDTDDLAELIEEIQAAHSSRPFWVDMSLCRTAVASWPNIRGRLVLSGIADPLRDLPTIYALIDAVESIILDGFSKEEDRRRYYSRLYTPPSGYMSRRKKLPAGWDRESEMAAFDDWDASFGMASEED